jgi:hypothetical protein
MGEVDPNDDDDPFRAFVEQVDSLTCQALANGSVSADILAHVASSVWTFPHPETATTTTTTDGTSASNGRPPRRLPGLPPAESSSTTMAAVATKERPAAAGNYASKTITACDDCGASLLHVDSLSQMRIERTPQLTRSQRRRAARRRKTYHDDLLCCKTINIMTCYRCGATFQVPGVRNPRPLLSRQRAKNPARTISTTKQRQRRPDGIPSLPAKAPTPQSIDSFPPAKRNADAKQHPAPVVGRKPPTTTTLDRRGKKKQKKNPKSDLMEFLSSLND